MRAQRRSDATARVAAILAHEGLIEGPFTIRIESADGAVEIRCDGLPDRPILLTKEIPAWPEFSPIEERIVACLRGRAGWMVTADLAKALGEEPGTEFRVIVRNLGDRGVLETNQRLGVRLVEPTQQSAENRQTG